MTQQSNHISTGVTKIKVGTAHSTEGTEPVVKAMPMEVEVILSGSGQESERVPSINKDLFKLVGFTPLYNLPPNIKGNISPGKQAVVNALINPAVLVTSEKGNSNEIAQAQTGALQNNGEGLKDEDFVYSIPEDMLDLKEGGGYLDQIGSMKSFSDIDTWSEWISFVLIAHQHGAWYPLNVEFAYPDDLFEKPKISEEDKDRLVLIIDSEDVKSTYPMLDIAAIKKAFTRSKWAFNRAGLGAFVGGVIDLDNVD